MPISLDKNSFKPFFSICIPVYKNVEYFKRLLDTVLSQTFADYEIIITDDSPDHNLSEFLKQHYADERIYYYRNFAGLGTPENWNEAIRKAKGKWIKLMHDDDWFCTDNALQILFDTVQNNTSNFYFSAYNNVYLDEANRTELIYCPASRWKRVLNFPPNLYARNIIGPPSVILVKNDNLEVYDNRMKWLVDIDYYIRLMKKSQPVYINRILVNVGMGSAQVTEYTHNKPEVEIPEGLLLLSKLGEQSFDHVLYFDAWWRLIRNLNIRTIQTMQFYSSGFSISSTLYRMIKFQKILPAGLLKAGIFSKAFMLLLWLYNKLIPGPTH